MRTRHRVSTTTLHQLRGGGFRCLVRAPWYSSVTGWGYVWIERNFS